MSKLLRLPSGTAVSEMTMQVNLSFFDLTAATCRLLAKGKTVTCPKQCVKMALHIFETRGLRGLVQAGMRYPEFREQAEQIVRRLFPEML